MEFLVIKYTAIAVVTFFILRLLMKGIFVIVTTLIVIITALLTGEKIKDALRQFGMKVNETITAESADE